MSPLQRQRVEQVVLPHLDAAYDLARWLTRNDQDAQDVVQEAFLRAARFIDTHRNGGDSEARAWVLAIVRNTCFSWLRRNHPEAVASFDGAELEIPADASFSPDEIVGRVRASRTLNQALAALPVVFREVVVLRDLEGLSYKEIATVVNVPIGTVMSRLARARGLLRESPLVQSLVAADGGV